uniref:Uncharacterized protein n=1 Tax=Knipowitschia caucasica TaxID=637954 RepID=A0AAV2MJ98_KNICA
MMLVFLLPAVALLLDTHTLVSANNNNDKWAKHRGPIQQGQILEPIQRLRCERSVLGAVELLSPGVGIGHQTAQMMLVFLLPAVALLLDTHTLVSANNNNDKWLSTVAQYNKDRSWNRFRDDPALPSQMKT